MEKEKIVQFDVDGRLFKIRRSLLESHEGTMLARSAAEVWKDKDNPDAPIFINRDSQRFSHVLDYLRDGKVSIPITVSKRALLKDLDYYGFPEVRNQDISVDVPTYEAGVHFFGMIQRYKEKVKALDERANELKQERLYLEFTCECLKKFSLSASPIIFESSEGEMYDLASGLSFNKNALIFAKCLKDSGLVFASVTRVDYTKQSIHVVSATK